MRWGLSLAGSLVFASALALAAATPLADRAAASPLPRPSHTAAPREAAPDGTDAPRRHHRPGPFVVPIAGGTLPTEAGLLPDAARDFRAGVHEGFDIPAPEGTPVLAMARGVVVRVDAAYVEWTAEQRASAYLAAQALGYTPGYSLDRTRGRQVWVDHGGGVTTRYAHLASVARLTVGAVVEAGEVIGTVGSSGLPEGGPHLHFEIRLGDSYLGEGLTPADLAVTLRRAFP